MICSQKVRPLRALVHLDVLVMSQGENSLQDAMKCNLQAIFVFDRREKPTEGRKSC